MSALNSPYCFHSQGFKLRPRVLLRFNWYVWVSSAFKIRYGDVSLNRNDASDTKFKCNILLLDAECCYLGRDFSSRQTGGGWPDSQRRGGDSGQDRGQLALDETVNIFREIKFNCPVELMYFSVIWTCSSLFVVHIFIWVVPLVTGDGGGGDWWCWCDKGVIRTESSVCWSRPMQIRVEGQTFERQIWEEMKTSKLNLTQSALCHPTAAAVKSKCLTKGAKSEKPNITGEIRARQMP